MTPFFCSAKRDIIGVCVSRVLPVCWQSFTLTPGKTDK
jgi:hypothetical protein